MSLARASLRAAKAAADPLEAVRRLRRAGRLDQAQALCQRLLRSRPDWGDAWYQLGLIDRDAGRPEQALQRLRQAARHAPALPLLAELGEALLALRDDAAAEAVWRDLAARAPNEPAHHANLGVALQRRGRSAEAVQAYRRALALNPALAGARSNLASALKDLGDAAAAEQAYALALQASPHDPVLYSNWLFASSHLPDLSREALYARHRAYGATLQAIAPLPAVPRDAVRAPGQRLRIGFVSADLRAHAVAFFVLPVWQSLDRDRFEVWAYAQASGPADATTQALRALTDGWREVGALDDEALARRIRADGIDVLVDLSGHTAGNRLPAFARRPAPVQASWIGYPCSTGLPAIDYFFTDPFMAPPAEDAAFVEKLVRLPAVAAFEPPAQAPEVAPLPALERGVLTFGSFHRPAKLSERTLERWAALLHAVPGSRLLLGHCDDALAASQLEKRLAARGVDASRLLMRPRLPLADYLALHGEVDLVLDACEFSGGTTTAHALWMGVPVLAVEGATMPARQSAAMLRHLGLDDFVAAHEQDFVDRGVTWSRALPALAALRAGLRSRIRALPLLSHCQVTRGFEQAVGQAWQRWRDGLQPIALDVSGQPPRCNPSHEPLAAPRPGTLAPSRPA